MAPTKQGAKAGVHSDTNRTLSDQNHSLLDSFPASENHLNEDIYSEDQSLRGSQTTLYKILTSRPPFWGYL